MDCILAKSSLGRIERLEKGKRKAGGFGMDSAKKTFWRNSGEIEEIENKV